MIQVIDDLFDNDFIENTLDRLKSIDYKPAEKDRDDTPPTGEVAELDIDDILIKIITQPIRFGLSKKGMVLKRTYINKFKPGEQPYWHHDELDGVTVLYYANTGIRADELGCTEFYLKEEDEIKAIRPVPGRLVMFDGYIQHRATSMRTRNRYTIALKYGKKI
jgi:hypothetical protein